MGIGKEKEDRFQRKRHPLLEAEARHLEGDYNRGVIDIQSGRTRLSLMRTKLLVAIVAICCAPGFASDAPSSPIYGVRMENIWIPMKDGVRLAATLYMPDGAKPGERFPALLEYLPYRKDDDTAAEDYGKHAYFAHRGYVSVRVDIRGFGASEGVPPEREYSETEQQDCEQVIRWLATQPWSNGNVGMFGISWGGFSALQMAMRHPPQLKAIIAVDATAELFHDDVHYMDGMAHIDEFELNMDMAEGWTGAPDYTLDEKVLGPRFDAPPWSLLYLKHQHDGPFWSDRVRPAERNQNSRLSDWRDARRLSRQHSRHVDAIERAREGDCGAVEPYISE